jgi:hypothetical protein
MITYATDNVRLMLFELRQLLLRVCGKIYDVPFDILCALLVNLIRPQFFVSLVPPLGLDPPFVSGIIHAFQPGKCTSVKRRVDDHKRECCAAVDAIRIS